MKLNMLSLLLATLGPPALAQTTSPIPLAKDEQPPTREWVDILRVTQQKTWDVTLSVKARFSPQGDAGPEKRGVAGPPVVNEATFVLPWVKESATQRADQEVVAMRGWLNLAPMNQPWARLQSPPGLERLGGISIKAPAGQTFEFDPPPGSSVRSHTFSVRPLGKPAKPAAGGSSPTTPKRIIKTAVKDDSGLFAHMEIRYRSTSRRVKLDADLAGRVGWPATWPPEAMGAFEPQPYLDFDFDLRTGERVDLDPDDLDEIARNILKSGGFESPKQLSPLALARGVAEAVIPALQPSGRAQLFATTSFQNGGGDAAFIAPSPGGDVPQITGISAGFYVRDAVSILDSGRANDAERAVALAAIYRKLGLPARVMIAYQAQEDLKEKLAKPAPELLAPPLDDGSKLKEQKPTLPPFSVQRVRHGGRFKPGGGRPEYKPLERPKHTDLSPVLKPIAQDLINKSSRLKRVKFWVEFALYDPERGLAWVPVDTGSGGNDWTLGEVKDSERYVAVATGFWPTQVRRLYIFGSETDSDLGALIGINQGRQLQTYASMPGVVLEYPPRMPAAFWGMFTGPEQARVMWQAVGFDASRAVVNGPADRSP